MFHWNQKLFVFLYSNASGLFMIKLFTKPEQDISVILYILKIKLFENLTVIN